MALVYDPRTGTMVDDGRGVPGNPARAAAMQAQFAQPVTGPRGLVGAQPTPPAANPNAINIGQAAGDLLLGGLSTVPAAIADVARSGATRLLGGDVNTLPGGEFARTNAAVNRAAGGLGQLGTANSQFLDQTQASLLGSLGAQPATATPAPVAAPQPTPADEVVAGLPVTAPTPAPAMLDTQAINAQIATSLAGLRPAASTTQASVRGDYNMQNTDLGALRGRAAPTNGINFGFGVDGGETARQYLDRMAQVDQQRAAQRQLTSLNNEARWARESITDNASVGTIAAARQQLAALNPQINALTQNQGALSQLGLRNQGDLAVAGLQNQGAMARADLTGQYGLAQADLTGQYGLGAAGVKAQGSLAEQRAKAASPESQASLARANLSNLQLSLAQAALERGDVNGAVGIASGKGAPNQRIAEDMFGNPIGTYDAQGNLIPYTEEQLAEYRRVSGLAQGR